jgi:hypothetical protein
MEKKGRGGKMVTVIDGLPRNDAFLKEVAQELKRSCGTAGLSPKAASSCTAIFAIAFARSSLRRDLRSKAEQRARHPRLLPRRIVFAPLIFEIV